MFVLFILNPQGLGQVAAPTVPVEGRRHGVCPGGIELHSRSKTENPVSSSLFMLMTSMWSPGKDHFFNYRASSVNYRALTRDDSFRERVVGWSVGKGFLNKVWRRRWLGHDQTDRVWRLRQKPHHDNHIKPWTLWPRPGSFIYSCIYAPHSSTHPSIYYSSVTHPINNAMLSTVATH